MKFARALRTAAQAARANVLPGLLLQALMLVFLALYLASEGTRSFFAQVANLKSEVGFPFAFVSYAIAAAFLPELLQIAFFQRGRPTRRNVWNFLTAAPAWGCIGVLVDLFYRAQAVWFGTGNDWQTIGLKMVVDQFAFSPFLATPLAVWWFLWRNAGFHRHALRTILDRNFFPERVFPVQVAGWCIWIPGVCLVYFMPSELQIPVAVLIQTFWVLVFTFVNRPAPKPTAAHSSPAATGPVTVPPVRPPKGR